ncbi:unnamed protein product [Brugia timori]|uniref:Ovule protein n=1 Tax=Brugia timori TaxID=42155 RepID=A0A0R3QBY0_9BILA|nr:unnamed protein product [Brugia timori]
MASIPQRLTASNSPLQDIQQSSATILNSNESTSRSKNKPCGQCFSALKFQFLHLIGCLLSQFISKHTSPQPISETKHITISFCAF